MRGRLCEALLEKLLRWPPEFVLPGERYDINLLNLQDQPVITIETKEPGHIPSDTEYGKFFGRLRHYPSLRHAFVTNGSLWERYDIHVPITPEEEITAEHFEDIGPSSPVALFEDLGPQRKIGKRTEFVLNTASPHQAEEFFAPLDAALYLDLSKPLEPGSHRHRLAKAEPQFTEAFSGGLRDQIAEFRELFISLFQRLSGADLGADVAAVCRGAFQLWCERSYVVPPETVQREVEKLLKGANISAAQFGRYFRADCGFPEDAAVSVAEALYAERKRKGSTVEKRAKLLWPLYEQAVQNYCTQTAHVYVARLLLYRIGEDQGLFEEKISGKALQEVLTPADDIHRIRPGGEPPSLALIERLRSQMADFAPTVYESGEFDWWRITHREVLNETERSRLRPLEERLDVANRRLLRLLSLYDLGGVDLDIWRDIYQHYLPDEERQRLGGFYTPQELVDLALDYARFTPEAEDLCRKSLLDPASGSGAFIVGALQRLSEHLRSPQFACHRHLHAPGLPEWERAQLILEVMSKNIRAIDIHPFASFLTYMNFLFAVLPLYAAARRQRPDFRLSLWIFSANSLLTPGENGGQRELDLPVNSRIHLTQYARERYRQMAGEKFDFVVGNPPWGGILKGKLAPIFDERYKQQLAAEYPDTYVGKLDIYALFYDRGLKWLRSGGTIALVTQGSFVDKEWAGPHEEYIRGQRVEIMGLRRKLAEHASLRFLIDLNPFGQLFFGAMNIPCVSVFEKRPAYNDERAVIVLSSKKSWPRGTTKEERRRDVASIVRRSLELVEKTGDPLRQDFVSAFKFPLETLRGSAGGRWLLSPREFTIKVRPEWPRAAQLLEPSQGVTIGGEGCLSIFLMSEDRARDLGIEKALVFPIIKGHETTAWKPEKGDNVIFYPYHREKDGKWYPAFSRRKPMGPDALDFEHPLDKFEQDWIRRYGHNEISTKRLFEHRRDAMGLVKYPKAAEYLLKYYQQLSGRVFEKKSVLDWGKEWYEFHRPRNPQVIFGRPKIISPRLTPRVRFALDQEGIGVQDSCICLGVSEATREEFEKFRKRLSKLLGREMRAAVVLRYVLGFLNSSYAQQLLTVGHRPRPGDVFQISDEFLEELSIPVCRTKGQLEGIVAAVDACMLSKTDKALAGAEARLGRLVQVVYSDP